MIPRSVLIYIYIYIYIMIPRSVLIYIYNDPSLSSYIYIYNDTSLSSYIYIMIPRSVLIKMRNVSDKRYRENQNTDFMLALFFFRKSCRLWDDVEKYSRAGQATDDNMAHTHCMLGVLGYIHTFHGICNTYLYSPAIALARTHLNVTLYIQRLSC